MSLRSLLFLAMAAPAAAYEWYAVFKLEHGSEYKINLGQTGGTTAAPEYADDTMKLYFAEVNEGTAIDVGKLDALVDGAEAYMAGTTYCGTDAAAGTTAAKASRISAAGRPRAPPPCTPAPRRRRSAVSEIDRQIDVAP